MVYKKRWEKKKLYLLVLLSSHTQRKAFVKLPARISIQIQWNTIPYGNTIPYDLSPNHKVAAVCTEFTLNSLILMMLHCRIKPFCYLHFYSNSSGPCVLWRSLVPGLHHQLHATCPLKVQFRSEGEASADSIHGEVGTGNGPARS